MIDPVLVWLVAGAVAVAVAVEWAARGGRRATVERKAPRVVTIAPSPSFVDHTPRWMVRFGQVFGPEQLATFEHIVGMDVLKQELVDLVEPVLHRRAGAFPALVPTILLWGRRGAGKAVLARAVAGQYGARLVHVSARFLVPRDGGTLQPRIAMLVRYAATNAPSVLFVDDLEMIATDDADRRGQIALHDVLNELRRRDRRARSVVIAALTTADTLIPSQALAEVFDTIMHVDHPDAPAREALVERRLRRHRMVVDDIDAIVAMTAGRSRAELLDLVDRACGRAAISGGPAAVVAKRHFAAAARAPQAPPLVEELALGRDLRIAVRGLETMLSDPAARVGVILAGDDGTGKTTIARALAASTRRHLVLVTAAVARADAFEEQLAVALMRRPSLLVVDEHPLLQSPGLRAAAEGCLPGPHGNRIAAAIDRALAQPGVSVIALARRFQDVDPALRGRGRLDHEIWVSYPDKAARLDLVRQHLRKVRLRDVSPLALAEELRGRTPAEIGMILDDAVRSAERRQVAIDTGTSPDEPIVTPLDLWRATQLLAPAA